ncbi:hypothetical protein predicted by Glimmer/Critica [Limosilactobacillus fermentum]|nr:hypothetical protein predicted by Glimmer/Critica [Limosilactobacillus fermentum]
MRGRDNEIENFCHAPKKTTPERNGLFHIFYNAVKSIVVT